MPYTSGMPRRVAAERTAVAEYVQDRLVRETQASRGVAAEIARRTGFSSAHVANAKNHGTVGPDFEIAIASYWGMSVAELRSEASLWKTGLGGLLARLDAAAKRLDGIVDTARVQDLRDAPPPDAEALTEQQWIQILLSPPTPGVTPITQAKAQRDTDAAVARTRRKTPAAKDRAGHLRSIGRIASFVVRVACVSMARCTST